MQHGFEAKYSKAQCEDMIESYASMGRDDWLTEDSMRIARGLRLRDRVGPAAPGHAPQICLGTPSIAEDLLIGLRAVSSRITEECINNGKDVYTFGLFKHL